MQQLPYVESVDHETTPVPGSPDLVDVDFEIEEGLPGQFGGSLGYSETYGVTLGGNFIHSNFMGTGRRVALELRGGEYQKIYDINFTDPYRNIDGVSRTVSFTYQDITQYTSSTSDFETTTLSAGMNWTYPIANFQRITLGFAYQDAELLTSNFSSRQALEWVAQNGERFLAPSGFVGTQVKTLDLVTAWQLSSLNAGMFPTAGSRISAGLNVSVPGSDIEYYVSNIDFVKYIPIRGRWLFRIHNELSYGDAYGDDTTSIPPFRNRYGGGPGSVRGFKESYLGPRDDFGNPYGGNLLFANQFELIIPTPEKIAGSTRISLFFDAAGVFSTGGVTFFDKLGDSIDYGWDYDKLKKSVGIGVQWLAPLGLLQFSYATPLNEDAATDRFYGDEVERFQFSIGNAF
jgi:outer membrane protein insertion porin family